MVLRWRFLLVVLLSGQSGWAQAWTSQLFPKVNGKYTLHSVDFAGQQWALDDYSYAGYFLGARSPGAVPCAVQTLSATGDISAPLQAAINVLGQSGGGILRIPAGSYGMSAPVAIPYDNVSIEGAGSGQTRIDVASNYASPDPPYDGLFTFGRSFGHSNHGWIENGKLASTVSTVIRRGDMQVDADNASGIKMGDWIVVQQYFWPGLAAANSQSPDAWTPDAVAFSFTYLRQVTGKTNNRVFLDAPIPWTLDPANNPVKLTFTDNQMHENVGIRGLSIHFENNVGTETDSTGMPAPHGAAVFFEGVRNGWVSDVNVSNFPREGIYLLYSARITVLDCAVIGAQDKNGGGWGYGYEAENSQNILIKRSRGEQARHNFISARALTSVLAQTQNLSRDPTQPDDTHYSFEQAILWDKHTQQQGESLYAVNRGDQSTGAYQTLASAVVWNFNGDGTSKNAAGDAVLWGGEVHLAPSPNGQAILTGGPGADSVFDNSDDGVTPRVHGQQVPPAAGLQVGSAPNARKNVLYEGLGQSGLQPDSLFEAQLANRFSPPPADWVNACGAAPSAAANSVGNGFSNLPGAVSPGEIVTIYGANLGPAVAASLQIDTSGLVATSLAGTRVFFDGIAAPLVYALAGQVAAVVPYGVAGEANTTLLLQYQGQRSAPITLPVAAATPAILTADGSGKGQGLIANADGSGLNGPANPVARGGYILMYATGAGQTDPPGVDGTPNMPPYPKPLLPVEVRVAGVTADEQMVGAPQFLAGFLQVNVRIPMEAATGPAVPLELRVGGVASQSGVTLAVQ